MTVELNIVTLTVHQERTSILKNMLHDLGDVKRAVIGFMNGKEFTVTESKGLDETGDKGLEKTINWLTGECTLFEEGIFESVIIVERTDRGGQWVVLNIDGEELN